MFQEADITENDRWVEEQTDRLIAWEILQHSLAADYTPVEPGQLADKIGADKKLANNIIKILQVTFNERL